MSGLFWLFGPIKLNFFEAASKSGGFAPDLSFFFIFPQDVGQLRMPDASLRSFSTPTF